MSLVANDPPLSRCDQRERRGPSGELEDVYNPVACFDISTIIAVTINLFDMVILTAESSSCIYNARLAEESADVPAAWVRNPCGCSE